MKHYEPCPECKSLKAKVICIKYDEDGSAVRRKLCLDCDHRYYTLQYPEVHIENREIKYTKYGRKVVVYPLEKKFKDMKRSLSNWVYVRIKSWNPNIMTHEHGTVKSRIVCDSKRLVETIMTDISVLDNVGKIKVTLHKLYADLDEIHN